MIFVKRTFVFFFIFAILAGWLFSGWPKVWENPQILPEVRSTEAASSKKQEVELVNERTETTKKYLVQEFPNGAKQYKIVSSIASQHYKENYNDDAEQWKDIDPTIEAVDGKIVVAKTPYNLEVYQDKLGFRADSKRGGWTEVVLEGNPDMSRAVRSGNEIRYVDAFEGVDIIVEATNRAIIMWEEVKQEKAKRVFNYTYKESKGRKNIGVSDAIHAEDGNKYRVNVELAKNKVEETPEYTVYSRQEIVPAVSMLEEEEIPQTYPVKLDVVVAVSAGSDDAYECDGWIGYSHTDANSFVGHPGQTCFTGFRFLDVSIPSGATVDTFTVTMVVSAWDGTNDTYTLYLEDSGASPATFSSTNSPADRTKTTASFTIALNEPPGASSTSASGVTALQEIVDSYSGVTNIVVVADGTLGSNYHYVASYENTSYSEANITATWTTGSTISVVVVDGTVSYGTVALGASEDTTASGLNDIQHAVNNGTGTQNFNIKGQNATGGGCTWTLASSAGSDQYVHEFSTNGGTDWVALTTSYRLLASGVAVNGTQDFDLRITLPTSSVCYNQQNVDVTVQGVAG